MMDSYMILKKKEQRLKDLSTSEYEKMQDAIDNSKIFDELVVQLKILIEKCLREDNNALAIKALVLLADNIDCAEDMSATEKFITCLQDENLLSQKTYKAFYDNLIKK